MQYGRYIVNQHAEKTASQVSVAPSPRANGTALELKRILDITPVDRGMAKEQGGAVPRLVKLCETAYKFAVLMRRDDNLMRIKIPSVGTIIDETEHEPLHQEGDQNLPRANEVKCSISGALVSYVVGTNERTIVQKSSVTI
ncbi:uncharacterized protein PAC_03491 [Phialocephala subalpina]|uniref:Uncharacterized protein n=1 Tax=Phialocephala subalpina TaxID=576137 RepID=A0A1L7WLG2_9HELO|nr:uncharacterized protein PAC_03491 [Phialocephala subalpina]